MNRIRTALLASTLLTATTAFAGDMAELRGSLDPEPAPTRGIYIGGRGGLNALSGTAFTTERQRQPDVVTNFPAIVDPGSGAVIEGYTQIISRTLFSRFDQRYAHGWSGSGFIGYDFGTVFWGMGGRIEAEVGAFSNAVTSHHQRGFDELTTTFIYQSGAQTSFTSVSETNTLWRGAAARGRTNGVYALANYYIDMDFGPFRPFIGFGLGFGWLQLHNHSYDPGTGMTNLINSSGLGLAYQAGGGIAFDVTRNITLEAGYRLLGIRDVQVEAPNMQRSRTSATNQQGTLGLRVRF